MHYKLNIHNKNQNSTMKLIVQLHTKARNTSRGTDGSYPERIAALM